jgi:signal transduction histidine kinase
MTVTTAEQDPDRPHVVVHCRRERDRALIEGLLGQIGAAWSPLGSVTELARLIEADRVDLALADADGHAGRLHHLLRTVERHDGKAPPMVLIGRPRRLSAPVRRAAHRFHVSVLHRPFGRAQLASAVRDGLAVRDRQRGCRRVREQLRRAEALVDRLRRESEDDARRRSQLLAAVSHNLRTPVNELVLFCQVVQGGPLPNGMADVERLAAGLNASVASLRELVDDLLGIARFDLGALEFHASTFALAPFLDRTLGPARALAQPKRLPVHSAVEPPDLHVRTDPDALARIVQNLAANAVKFTDSGEIRVSARVAADGGLTLAVRDTGRGIRPESQSGIFDEFAQLHNPERDRTKGTGLGLAICRRLVAALGGRIDLDSAPGRGSTFTVDLPAQVVVQPGPRIQATSTAGA